MRFSYRNRRILAVLALVVVLPVYVVVVVNVMSRFDRLPALLELTVYVIAGIAWVFPLRSLFIGIGKPDPNRSAQVGETDRH